MYRKYYLVEVVILILLSHGGWNGPSVTLLSCTSESSKLVRNVVQKTFLPIVEQYRVSLPLECPLHPKRDMFWWLQTEMEATRVSGQGTWNCPVCGQKFKCENTFVTHWDASHARSIGMTEETVCLDDFCDVFRCDVLKKRMQEQRREEEEDFAREMSESRNNNIVIALKSNKREKSLHDNELTTEKQHCDAESMRTLQNKCRSLIRQCTIGMLANLSSKDFQDMEEDLDKSICSYLTCDKYWDNFESRVHHIPVLVIAIFGLLTVCLLCFCYYGIWLIMEKSPTGANKLCCNCQKSQTMDVRHRQKSEQFRYRVKSPEFMYARAPSRCAR